MDHIKNDVGSAPNQPQPQNPPIPPAGGIGNGGKEIFRFLKEDLAEVILEKVTDFQGLPEYRIATISTAPIMATVDGSIFHVLDGLNLVEAARQAGQETILTKVVYLPQDSPAVLAWAKSYLRMGPLDGNSSYAERGRNLLIVREKLIADGFIQLPKGGASKGEAYTEKLDKNVNTKLADIFRRSQRTIENIAHYFKHLNQACVATLVNGDAPKKFFETIESAKAEFVKEKKNLHDEATLTEVVSAQLAEWFTKFDKNSGIVEGIEVKSPKKGTTNKPPQVKPAGNDQKREEIPPVAGGEGSDSEPGSAPGEGIQELLLNRNSEGKTTTPDQDGGGTDDINKNNSEGLGRLHVIKGGGIDPANDEMVINNDILYSSLDQLGDKLKELAQRRPSPDELASELQKAIEQLLDLKETASQLFETEPLKKLAIGGA